LNLKDNRREQARDEFDRAVDAVLESGMDVRANPRLQSFYLELVERIYRLEVPQSQTPAAPGTLVAANNAAQGGPASAPVAPQVGFREQKFEPSPLDELSKLQLTPEEQNVTPDDVIGLEAAKSAINFPFKTNPLIQQYINYYQGRGRATMEAGLRRSGRFMQMARKIFREEGVPEDLAWLGQVESAWSPTAYSWAAASGLWQFVSGTGARFGLRQTAWVDERNGFEKATRASARYLKWLASRYNGNWELALGAYNTGEGNIDRAIARAGVADFWQIYPYIAQETRNYVPNILATILIAKNPTKYGFGHVKPEAPLRYSIVQVPTATSLRLIAEATDTTVDYLRSINPELRRDITPRGEAFNVRVPPGKEKQLVSLLKRIPVDQRETARIVSVAPGEDLAALANRTGTSLAHLQMLNAGVDFSRGGKAVLPGAGMVRTALVRARRDVADATATSGQTLGKTRARAGDTIAKIAARYNASVDEVARLNGMAPHAALRAGQEIRLPLSAAPAKPARSSSRRRR
jgi:membrane-bound lytic murein transglycosylase D